MIGRTNVGGGGKAVAAIGVTYPVGSTCTCTKGSRTLRAKDTSGKYLFLVPGTGAWDITATDGENTVTVQVIVEDCDAQKTGIGYSVYLFLDGTTSNEVGGWVNASMQIEWHENSPRDPDVKVSNGKLTASVGGVAGWSGAFKSANLVDVTNYKKLKFTVTKNNCNGNANYSNYYGLLDDSTTYYRNAPYKETLGNGVTGEVVVDITDAVGSYYIFVGLTSYAVDAEVAITSIILSQ